jgi:hypothetical protein
MWAWHRVVESPLNPTEIDCVAPLREKQRTIDTPLTGAGIDAVIGNADDDVGLNPRPKRFTALLPIRVVGGGPTKSTPPTHVTTGALVRTRAGPCG